MLVRSFTDDEPKQSRAVRQLFETRLTRAMPGHVNVVTLAETVWVLRRLYGAQRDEIARVVDSLLAALNAIVERKAAVRRSLQAHAASAAAGFSDCLIAQLNAEAGCQETLTFDRHAAKTAGFTPME